MSNVSTFLPDSEVMMNGTSASSIVNWTTDGLPSVIVYINYVFLPVSIIVVTIGNILTILVMRTERYIGSPSSYLLILLSVTDLVVILSQPFKQLPFIDLVGIDVRAFNDITCKLYIMIRRLSKMTSSWAVVGLCIERFIAVWFPLKAKLLITKRAVSVYIVTVLVVIIIYTSVWSYASKVVNGRCNPDVYDYTDPTERTRFGIMLQGGTAIYSNVPTILLVTLTSLIVIKLSKHKKKRKRMTSIRRASPQQDAKITAMLIGIVISFVILILPITFLHNRAFLKQQTVYSEKSSGFNLFKEIAQLMEKLNYCLNFFLYIMTSKQFRESIGQILFFRCSQKYKKREENSSTRSGSRY